MKKLTKILAPALLLTLLVTGCSLDDPESPTNFKAPVGAQYFENYVAIGNSLTAGFMDGGLIESGQADSYPALIAQQIGFSGFTQPRVLAPGIGSSTPSAADMVAGVLYFNGTMPAVLDETPRAVVEAGGLARDITQPAPYHNLGVPGAALVDVLSATSDANSYPGPNPYFNFINREFLYGNLSLTADVFELDGTTPKVITYQTASMGWQAIAKGPTLMTVFIGNNDVLGWATRGGDQSAVPITDPAAFTASFSDLMQVLAGGLVERTGFPATIIVGNVAGVTAAPYFVTESTFISLASAALGAAWTGGFEEAVGPNGRVRFPALSTLTGTDTEITAEYILTEAEVNTANAAVAQYNGAIAQIAAGITAKGIATVAVVDINTILNDIAAGGTVYGPLAGQHFMVALGSLAGDVDAAARATLFSLDGLHPNNRGYAVVANSFIEVINETLETSVADVDWDSKVWDPEYSWYTPAGGKAADDGGGILSARAAAQMDAVFR